MGRLDGHSSHSDIIATCAVLSQLTSILIISNEIERFIHILGKETLLLSSYKLDIEVITAVASTTVGASESRLSFVLCQSCPRFSTLLPCTSPARSARSPAPYTVCLTSPPYSERTFLLEDHLSRPTNPSTDRCLARARLCLCLLCKGLSYRSHHGILE